MTEYDAVCFDLDGTLCVADQDPDRLLERSFERAGVDPLFSMADAAAVDPATLPPADSDVEFHEYLFSAAASEAGTDPSAATVTALAEAHVDLLDPTQVSFRDGARDVLEYARERYALALVTNGGPETSGRNRKPWVSPTTSTWRCTATRTLASSRNPTPPRSGRRLTGSAWRQTPHSSG